MGDGWKRARDAARATQRKPARIVPIPGKWYLEADKGVKLCCISVTKECVHLAYSAGGTIAVCPNREDFPIFFEPCEPKTIPNDPAINNALNRFVNSGLTDSDKPVLRKHKLIAYSNAFWHLSDFGKAEAIRLGFLEST